MKVLVDIMRPNWENVNVTLKEVEDRLGNNLCGNMDGKEFARIIQSLLISSKGYVIDTGNWENVNYACAYNLIDKIKKHPLIWKLFFMIA